MLQRGDNGDAVRRVQDSLRRIGATISDPPGHFGLTTEAAIYLLQREAGLVADGVIGAQTEAALNGPKPSGYTPGSPIEVLLAVPYSSQRDNEHRPLATCNVTSLAMVLRYHGAPEPEGKQLEDELFEDIHSPEGLAAYAERSPALQRLGIPPENVLDCLVWVAQRRGYSASFSEERTILQIEGELAAERPVMLSGVFTGSGHIVALIGLCKSGDFIIHDPYGDWARGYKGSDGESRIYAREKVLAVLKPLNRAEKWGLFVDRRGGDV